METGLLPTKVNWGCNLKEKPKGCMKRGKREELRTCQNWVLPEAETEGSSMCKRFIKEVFT